MNVRIDGQAEFLEQLQAVLVTRDFDAVARSQAVNEQPQFALGALPRIEQLERAGSRVPRIGERLEILGDPVAIQFCQVLAVHVDFATRLEERQLSRQRLW